MASGDSFGLGRTSSQPVVWSRGGRPKQSASMTWRTGTTRTPRRRRPAPGGAKTLEHPAARAAASAAPWPAPAAPARSATPRRRTPSLRAGRRRSRPTPARRRPPGRTPGRRPGPRPTMPRRARTGRAGRPRPARARPPPAGTAAGRARWPAGAPAPRRPRRAPAPRRRGPGVRPGRSAVAAPGVVLAAHEQAGRVDLAQARRAPISNQARLALGAEPVLAAGEHPQTRARIPVERQDDVDGMLERARTRQVAVLRHVAGEEHRDALGLRQPDERVGADPHLRRHRPASACRSCPGGSGSSRPPAGTARSARAVCSTCARSRPGANRDRVAREPSRRARAATCAWDSSPATSRHALPATARCATRWSSSVDLPMPGSPASRATDAGTRPPPSTRSTPSKTRRHPVVVGCRRHRSSGAVRAEPCAGPAGGSGALLDGAPRAAAGTPPHPLRDLLAAVTARRAPTRVFAMGRTVATASDTALLPARSRAAILEGPALK